MHVLTNTKPIPMGSLGELPAGQWLVDNQNAFELALMGERGDCRIRFEADAGRNVLDGESILLVRSGAIGDLLFLSPAIRAFRAKFPNSKVSLACFPKHHELVKDFPVDAVISYPVPLNEADGHDAVISLENCMELNPGLHATDAFAQTLGVTVEDYRPIYSVSSQEMDAPGKHCSFIGRQQVGLQLRSSRITRDYPLPLWAQVIEGLTKRGWDVYLFGSPGQIPDFKKEHPQVFNLSTKGLSFRESVACLSVMDVFCGVDSGLLPVCHALDKPAIGLYGPFAWETRTGKAPKTRAISGNGPCAPCSWHTHAGRHFPPHCPSGKLGFCGVLADIPPERIIAQIDKFRL